MALSHAITVFLIAFVATIDFAACRDVKGKVSCLDCPQNYYYSGIQVAVLCKKTKKVAVAATEADGSFRAEIPADGSKSSSSRCLAKLLGGPTQLYASRNNMVSGIVNSNGSFSTAYTVSKPLSFSTSCPQATQCEAAKDVRESKTIDLPLPPEWGLAPSSYYVPFIPIIGIP